MSPAARAELLVSEAAFRLRREFPALSHSEALSHLACGGIVELGRVPPCNDPAEIAYQLADTLVAAQARGPGVIVAPTGIPDRLCGSMRSPFYNRIVHLALVYLDGVRIERAVEYCISEGWITRSPGPGQDLEIMRGVVTVEWSPPKPPESGESA